MEGRIRNLDSVADCNRYMNIGSRHSLVNVVNVEQLGDIKQYPKRYGIYGIACDCTPRNNEGDTATLYFVSPGHISSLRSGVSSNLKGWLLIFHPKLMKNTMIMHYLSNYPFFADSSGTTIKLNRSERDMVINCMRSINEELLTDEDHHTINIVVSGIAVLLCLCMRYYDRQCKEQMPENRSITTRLDKLLNDHIAGVNTCKGSIPTVAWCAQQLNISANYFGDLIKRNSGHSAQEHIHRRIVDEVKLMLRDQKLSISDISYRIGFKYPHHLTRIFRKYEGCSPQQYRSANKKW